MEQFDPLKQVSWTFLTKLQMVECFLENEPDNTNFEEELSILALC